jgi:hypothetical protein
MALPNPSISKLYKYKEYKLLDYIGAPAEHQLGELEVAVARGSVYRRLSVLILRVNVGASLEKPPNDGRVPALCSMR